MGTSGGTPEVTVDAGEITLDASGAETTLLAEAERTASTWTDVIDGFSYRGAYFVLEVTAEGSPDKGKVKELWIYIRTDLGNDILLHKINFPDLDIVGQRVMMIYPGDQVAGEMGVSPVRSALPNKFKLYVLHNDTKPITYKLSAFPIS